jgi:hypothetical protein
MNDDAAETDPTNLESVRSEYARLLGISRRTDAQEARYVELSDLLERWPQPFLTEEEQRRYREAADRFDEAVLGMSEDQRARLMRYIG